MPRVLFVNECRVVEAEPGQNVRDVAREVGVALGRVCWVEESAPGASGPRTWLERMRGLRGWRRLAGSARVMGDLKVYSAPAAANRVGGARVIAPVPMPTVDPHAARKPDDAASTSLHIYGHPGSVGRGQSAATQPIPPAPPSRPNAARPASTYPVARNEGESEDPSP